MTKLLNKFHRFLFCLLILFLPVQLGKHFWPDWALVGGIRIDYLSLTIYLTDILVLGILVSWSLSLWLKTKNQKPKRLFQKLSDYSSSKPRQTRGESRSPSTVRQNSPQASSGQSSRQTRTIRTYIISAFFLFSFFIVNIFLAQNRPVAFFRLLKLAELFFLGLYVKNNFSISQFLNFSIILSFTIIYSSIIAWAQFLRQSSIGGLLWWLGERTFVSSTPGIAQVVLDGRLFLRPYAAFPHPNVLAGYLAVAMPLIMINQKPKTNSSSSDPEPVEGESRSLVLDCARTIRDYRALDILRSLSFILGITTLFITFSRSGWIAGGTGIVISLLLFFFKALKQKKQESRRWLKGRNSLFFIVLYSLFFVLFLFLGKERLGQLRFKSESLQLRQELNKVALAMIKKYPLTGVGLGNFIPSLAQFKKGLSHKELQPAHNIYLLISAETGLFGLALFVLMIFLTYRGLISKSKFLISKQILSTKHQKIKSLVIRSLGIRHYLGQLGIRSIRNLAQVISTPLFISLTCILLLGLVDHYFFTLQQTQLLFAIVLGMVFGQDS